MTNVHSADLSALIAYVDDLETRLSAARATKLDNLDAKVSEVVKQVALTGHPSDSLGKILYDFSNTRLTAARCAFLANINNANLSTIGDISSLSATEIAHLDADISGSKGSPLSMIDIWSAPSLTAISLTSSAGDKTLPDVVIPDLGTFTLVKAYAMFTFSSHLEEASSNNYTTTDTFIQVDKAAAGYINALSMPDRAINARTNIKELSPYLAISDLDISTRVANNATTNFKWVSAVVDATSLDLLGVQTGVRLIVS